MKPTIKERKLAAKHQNVNISDKKSIKILKARDKVSDWNDSVSNACLKSADKEIKDLEEIIKIQENTIKNEKIVSNNILNRLYDQEQIIIDWKYSYRLLEWKYAKALEDIRFLDHYIKQKEIKKEKNENKK